MAIITRWHMPPGELERVLIDPQPGLGDPDMVEHGDSRARAPAPARSSLRGPAPSAICRPTVINGSSEATGSWKIMPMRPPRTASMSRAQRGGGGGEPVDCACPRAGSPRRIAGRPPAGGRFSASAVRLLPQPLSPTRARVSPSVDREVDAVDDVGLADADPQVAPPPGRGGAAGLKAHAPRRRPPPTRGGWGGTMP